MQNTSPTPTAYRIVTDRLGDPII